MSDEIFEIVEPLVDGITNLISSAYSKDLEQMKDSSEIIAVLFFFIPKLNFQFLFFIDRDKLINWLN